MKKMILLTLAASLLNSVSYANQQITIGQKNKFSPFNWQSANTQEVISIVGDFNASVQIAVNNISYIGSKPTGINIKNCGNVTHVNAGSSVICAVWQGNPPISFSSDSDDSNTMATGVYQVE
jgi:hypothetical protein